MLVPLGNLDKLDVFLSFSYDALIKADRELFYICSTELLID